MPDLRLCPLCQIPPKTGRHPGAGLQTFCPQCRLGGAVGAKKVYADRNWELVVSGLTPSDRVVSPAYMDAHDRMDRLGIPQREGEYLLERCLRLIARCEAEGMKPDRNGGLPPVATTVMYPQGETVCPDCLRPYPTGRAGGCPSCAAGAG